MNEFFFSETIPIYEELEKIMHSFSDDNKKNYRYNVHENNEKLLNCWHPFRVHLWKKKKKKWPSTNWFMLLTHNQNESVITFAESMAETNIDNIFETGWGQSAEKYIAFIIQWVFLIDSAKKKKTETITTFFSRLFAWSLCNWEKSNPFSFGPFQPVAFKSFISHSQAQWTLDGRTKWFCRPCGSR